jgi:hypothetical protein
MERGRLRTAGKLGANVFVEIESDRDDHDYYQSIDA